MPEKIPRFIADDETSMSRNIARVLILFKDTGTCTTVTSSKISETWDKFQLLPALSTIRNEEKIK